MTTRSLLLRGSARFHVACVATACAVTACGGANLNRRTAGNREGGIAVRQGEIAVDKPGRFILIRAGSSLLLGDVTTMDLSAVDEVSEPGLVAFWTGRHGAGFFALSGYRELLSYDLDHRRVMWRRSFDEPHTRLDVTPDGARIVLAGETQVTLVDAESGQEVGSFRTETTIEDLDLTPDSARVIVTERERWLDQQPQTAVRILAAQDGAHLCTALVPNCADELVVDPDGERAFLAPTYCRRDPVSIVDVTESCGFERNLPGFGPIALTADGATGVAFLDRSAADPSAPPLPAEVAASSQRYHLMLFDTRTLRIATIPVGENLPRYALTPDGRTLIVDGLADLQKPQPGAAPDGDVRAVAQPVRLVDVGGAQIRLVSGPNVMLESFTVDGDSRDVWLIHSDEFDVTDEGIRPTRPHLFHIDIEGARVELVPLPFAPLSINALPSSRALLLRSADNIHVFDTDSRRLTASFREN